MMQSDSSIKYRGTAVVNTLCICCKYCIFMFQGLALKGVFFFFLNDTHISSFFHLFIIKNILLKHNRL
uniref:Uncharacterized protein n=1 Tax=Anguilla anguilla TaxID=7936 RepID=A0A0E9QTL5_ANGAN